MIRAVCTLLLFASTMPASAGWSIQYPNMDSERKQIDDSFFSFMMDDVVCGVRKTKFTRLPNDQVIEMREIWCDLGQDIKVFDSVSCNYPSYTIAILNFSVNKSVYSPILTCGPTK